VTVSTRESSPRAGALVGRQREANFLVGEAGHIGLGEAGSHTMVFGMTDQTGSAISQHTVERIGTCDLSLNISVTIEATLVHRALTPRGVMARSTIVAESGVRCHPTERDAIVRLSVEGTRAKHRAAA